MSIISTRTRRVKSTRHTSRPAAPFGAGLTRFVAFAVTAPGFVDPSDEDKAAAAAMFARDDEPDYDLFAGEAAFLASCEAMTPPPVGHCRSCGQPSEALSYGLCDACDDAGTEATIKGENGRAGPGYRVF
jgi:hypothetical protein